MTQSTDRLSGLVFIKPATTREGFARLLAATLYRENPGIPFMEVGIVEHEINQLRRWCRKELTEPSFATQKRRLDERRAKREQERRTALGVTQEPEPNQQP